MLIFISSNSTNFGTNDLFFFSIQLIFLVKTLFNNTVYDMAPQSVVIMDGSSSILFNSSHVKPVSIDTKRKVVIDKFTWKWWNDRDASNIPIVKFPTPIEQLTLTQGESDYLYYTRSISVSSSGTFALNIRTEHANGFLVFVDNALQTMNDDHRHDADGPLTLPFNLTLTKGDHTLMLLSVSLGITSSISSKSKMKKGT